jgi:hypothetical protein
MPLDNVKTRMQSLGAEGRYRNSLDCFMQVRGNQAFEIYKELLTETFVVR